MAHKNNRTLKCIRELAICAELSHETICEWQYSIGGPIIGGREGFGIVMVGKNSDVVSLVWEQVSEPKDA